MVIKSGISQIGGKYRLRKTLLEFTPYHEFFLSMFTGAAHFELNKPRCRYECFNDGESDIINYLVQIQEHQKEFDVMKQGVFGLVSQEICNRIVNGKIQPKNDLEKAYFFYYLNKLTFGGSIWKVRKKPPWRGMTVDSKGSGKTLTEKELEDLKEAFEIKTKGYIGLIDNQTMSKEGYGRVDSKVVEHAKEEYEIRTKAGFRGISPAGLQEKVNDAKANFRGVTPKAPFKGIMGGTAITMRDDIPKIKERYEKATERYRAVAYKGTNPKTTRPYTNNDCGLLSPIEPEAIKRLRYVNLTAYDFRKVYKMFYDAFHVRKGLGRECFVYSDSPYPGTEKYYGDLFKKEDHHDLLQIALASPFNFMLSMGGKCEELYIEPLREANWVIEPVKVKYSTDANSQKESQEYICMNYEIRGEAKMILPSDQKILNKFIEDSL